MRQPRALQEGSILGLGSKLSQRGVAFLNWRYQANALVELPEPHLCKIGYSEITARNFRIADQPLQTQKLAAILLNE